MKNIWIFLTSNSTKSEIVFSYLLATLIIYIEFKNKRDILLNQILIIQIYLRKTLKIGVRNRNFVFLTH